MQKAKKTNTRSMIIFFALFLIIGTAVFIGYREYTKKQDKELINNPVNQPIGVDINVKNLIAETHAKYNELTGYGAIDQLDSDKAIQLSNRVKTESSQALKHGIKDKRLNEDFSAIQKIAAKTSEQPEKEKVRLLHRYFHDLDIAVNRYKDTNTVFGVTKTLPKRK